jgi:hypothetical protein
MRKGKDPDPGGPKTCGSCGSGSSTLFQTKCRVPVLKYDYRFQSHDVDTSAGIIIVDIIKLEDAVLFMAYLELRFCPGSW